MPVTHKEKAQVQKMGTRAWTRHEEHYLFLVQMNC